MLSSKTIQRVSFLLISILSFAFMGTASKAGEPIVSRTAFTTAIVKHEPVDEIKTIDSKQKKVYFFTEIKNYKGRTITHQWSVGNWVVQSIPLSIQSNRWRTSSSKSFSIDSSPKGTWVLRVLDEQGNVLKESYVNYIKASSTIKRPKKNRVKKTKKSNRKVTKKNKTSLSNKPTRKEKATKSSSVDKPKTKVGKEKLKEFLPVKNEDKEPKVSSDNDASKKLSDEMNSISKRVKKVEEDIAELVNSVNDMKEKQETQPPSKKEVTSEQVEQAKEETAELVNLVDDIKAEAATTNAEQKASQPSTEDDDDECTDDE